jgi:hypothetical protein
MWIGIGEKRPSPNMVGAGRTAPIAVKIPARVESHVSKVEMNRLRRVVLHIRIILTEPVAD